MIDYSDKSWLREEPFVLRAIGFMLRMAVLAAILFALAAVIGQIEAWAATRAVLFEPSSEPLTFAEAVRAHPELGRPASCMSAQHRSNEPWHRRVCWYDR